MTDRPFPARAEKVATFRALHQRAGAFIMPNPWDVGSARIFEDLGFEALATTSAGFAWTLGRLDHCVARDEKIAHARALCAATRAPVAADLGNGFADAPEDVADTIRLAAAAGLAGGSIEDAKADGSAYDIDLAVARIAAAAKAAREVDGGFVLTARTEHFLRGGSDVGEAIERLQAFETAGAEVLFAPGVRRLDDVKAILAAIARPLNVLVGIPGFAIPAADLEAAGVKRLSIGADLARIAYAAAHNAGAELMRSRRIDAAGIDAPGLDFGRLFG
ncbi:MAG: isocitrate lyase/phosphoenolpyruvate mutase family protein [Alphaproteobacteria bacterium]|nr:isocitrate lyase/phosphoenolpyruvate mutase family protein [Alphaproteobacteria bacterium]